MNFKTKHHTRFQELMILRGIHETIAQYAASIEESNSLYANEIHSGDNLCQKFTILLSEFLFS